MVSNPFHDGLSVEVGAETDQFQSEMGSAIDRLTNFKSVVGAAGAALAALSAKALSDAASASMSFADSITELEKRVGEDIAAEAREGINEMANDIPMSREEISALADDAARFGVEGTENILEFTETAAMMSEATQLSADEAGEAMVKLSELTGVPIEDVEHLASSVNSLSNTAAASSDEIVEASLKSAGALSSLGLRETEIFAINSALLEVSESAPRAGTRLRTLADDAMDPAKAESLAGALGMNVEEFERMRNDAPMDLLMEMIQQFDSNEQAAEELSTTLSGPGRDALRGLASNAEGLNEHLQTSNEEFERGESLQEEFAVEMQKFSAQVQIIRNRIRGFAMATGDRLLPTISTLFSVIADGIGWLADFNARLNGLPGLLTALGGIISGTAVAVGAFGGALSSSAVASAGLSGALTGLSALIAGLTGPFGIAAAAVSSFALGYKNNWAGIRDTTLSVVSGVTATVQHWMSALQGVIQPHVAQLREIWSWFWSDVEQSTRQALTAVGSIISTVTGSIRSAWEGHTVNVLGVVDRLAGGVVNSVRSMAVSASNRLWDATNTMASLWAQHETAVAQTVQTLTSRVLQGFQSLRATLGPVVGGIASGVMAAFDHLQTTIGPVLSQFRERVVSGFQSIVEFSRPVLNSFVQTVTTVFGEIRARVVPLVGQVRDLWLRHRDTVNQAIRTVISAVGSLLSSLSEIGSSAAEHLGPAVAFVRDVFKSTLRSAFDSVKDAGQTLIDLVIDVGTRFGLLDEDTATAAEALGQLLDPFKKVELAISSVDEVFGQLTDVWDEDWAGIRTTVSESRDRLSELFGGIESDGSASFEGITQTVEETFFGVVTRVEEEVAGLRTAWNEDFGELQATTSETFGLLEQIYNEIVSPILGLILESARENLSGVSAVVDTHLGDVLGEFTETLNHILENVVNPILQTILDGWERWGDEIMTGLELVMDTVGTIFETGLDFVLTTLRTVMALLRGDWEEAWTLVEGFFTRTFGRIMDFAGEWGGRLLDWLGGLVDGVIGWFEDLARDLIGGSIIPDMLSDIMSAFESFGAGVLSWLGALVSDFTNDVGGWASGFVSDIDDMGSDALSEFESFVSDTLSAVTTFGSDLLSSVNQTLDDVRRAAADKLGKLRDLFERRIESAHDSVTDTLGRMLSAFRNIIDDIRSAVAGKMLKLVNLVERRMDSALSKVTNLKSRFKSAGRGLMTALKNGIKNAAGKATGAVDDVVSDVRSKLPGSDAEEGPLADLSVAGQALPETIADNALAKARELERASETLAAAARPDLTAGTVPAPPAPAGGAGDETNIHIEVDARGAESARQVERRSERGLSRALDAHNVGR